MATPADGSTSTLTPSVQSLLDEARNLYKSTFPDNDLGTLHASHAPGRVNLIGEHVDYTGGYVLPMAIPYGTVCYGRGYLLPSSKPQTVSCQIVSSKFIQSGLVSVEAATGEELKPYSPDSPNRWSNYVLGVVREYLPTVPNGKELHFTMAIAGNVPLGSGLSSSAALEVSVATFLESILDITPQNKTSAIGKALKCQNAERTFCGTPCGIMDQFVSATAMVDCAILIDCQKKDYIPVHMGSTGEKQIKVVICNSNVQHDNAGGEYPLRVLQCAQATTALRLANPDIKTLRDATLSDVEKAKAEGKMEDVVYHRARHVVTENARTLQAKTALEGGDFVQMGRLMNESHDSMRDDYEVSCEEIDLLVDLAQKFSGVYGSRLTGGGFGGCTVTLVDKEKVGALVEHLKREYEAKFDGQCTCFETSPADGARVIDLK